MPLLHTIRNSNGTWQSSFDSIESQSSGGPPAFLDVACGSADGQALQVVGVGSDGKLWHTIRNSNKIWQASFQPIESQSSGGPPAFNKVGCAGAETGTDHDLQVVGVGNDGKLWHTIRNSNGTWQPSFQPIESQSSGGPAKFQDVACGSADGQALQVVGVGSDGNLWHTIRNSNGNWQASFEPIESQSSGGPPFGFGIDCAGAETGNDHDLQVVGVGNDGKLWHTIRNSNGTWQPRFEPIESQSSGGRGTFLDVACGSADGQALQVVGVGSDGNLWHTIRNSNGNWQASFEPIESQSSGGPPFGFGVGCAGAETGTDHDLQVVSNPDLLE
jgi:ABC-type cobalt transport system substrate-binding protein